MRRNNDNMHVFKYRYSDNITHSIFLPIKGNSENFFIELNWYEKIITLKKTKKNLELFKIQNDIAWDSLILKRRKLNPLVLNNGM